MKRPIGAFLLLWSFVFAMEAQAVTVYYQPTPYPQKKYDGSAMPQNDVTIVHLMDGWVNNWFGSIKPFQNTDQLKIGGWSDTYTSLIKFDITGLPQQVDNAYFSLYSLPRGGANPSQVSLWKAIESWNTNIVWGDQTQSGYPENYSPWIPDVQGGYSYSPVPSENIFYPMWITPWYNGWKSGTYPNEGIVIYPYDGLNNQFDYFASSNHANDALRPTLRLHFTPTLELKMPLPGNIRWLVTTEIGGYDCLAKDPQYWPDTAHQGGNYFSVDFSWRNKNDAGAQIYTETSDIPVIAAGGGKVLGGVDYNSTDPNHPNGYFVAIDHDYDGNSGTGFSTRYLHLKSPPVVVPGQVIAQGDLLGYMGNTGISSGVHLHFGVRYNNSGASTVSEITKVVMDGWILKSFQTECAVSANGIPQDPPIRYYRSGNRVY